MANTDIDDVINKFNAFTSKPVKYLTAQKNLQGDIKNLVKSIYDFTKIQENSNKKEKKSALPALIVADFDEEQIWQEIELQNIECWDHLVWQVAKSLSAKTNLVFPVKISDADKKHLSVEKDESLQSEDSKLLSESENEAAEEATLVNIKPSKIKTKLKTSVVDDNFFKLAEMEKFLLREEKKENNKVTEDSDDESIDMFEEIDDKASGDEETGNDMMYSDFFDDQSDEVRNMEVFDNENTDRDEEHPMKREKKVTFANEMSVDENDTDESSANRDTQQTPTVLSKYETKSDFELRQQRLKQTIERLEEKTMKDAPWQLRGEVDASKRPQNSLLEEVVDFDLTSRPPPIITEQTTVTLEELIKQRIKDKAWDDVVKKQKPVDDQLSFRKPEVIDQSKSKLSLAQVYEAEYLKQKQAQSGDNEEEKEPESHKEIRETMSQLFSKLDALCHYHYTPKPPQAEVKIVTNTPAISMEEVAPVATSDATLLAPEEIKKKRRGDLMSKDERTQTDKNRERRKKKKLQKLKGKVTKVTEHRNTKKGVEASDKSLKTSKAFFQQLNDNSRSLIYSKKRKQANN